MGGGQKVARKGLGHLSRQTAANSEWPVVEVTGANHALARPNESPAAREITAVYGIRQDVPQYILHFTPKYSLIAYIRLY